MKGIMTAEDIENVLIDVQENKPNELEKYCNMEFIRVETLIKECKKLQTNHQGFGFDDGVDAVIDLFKK